LKPDFNLLDAFKMVDSLGLGYVSITELSSKLAMIFEIDTLSGQGL